jgi:hypothetical protein
MKAPWHLWLIGIVTLIWHAFGAFDYTMTQTANEAYLAQFTPEQKAYFTGYPAWATAGWATGVWGTTLGSVLILSRSRFALHAFVVALIGSLLAAVYSFGVADQSMAAMMGSVGVAITVVIYAVVVAMIWYSVRMTAAGVLR